MRPARWVFLKRVIPAVLCFTVAQGFVTREHEWDIKLWVTRQGQAAGCPVLQSRYYLIGERGPFFGYGFKNSAWNFAWRHCTLAAASATGLVPAVVVYALLAGPLGRTRAFGYRGPTRCGACGYALAGLTEPRCPECGREI